MNLSQMIEALRSAPDQEIPGVPKEGIGCPPAEPIQIADIVELLEKVKKCCDELNEATEGREAS